MRWKRRKRHYNEYSHGDMPLLADGQQEQPSEQPGLMQYARDYLTKFGQTLLGTELKRRQYVQDTLDGTNAKRSWQDLTGMLRQATPTFDWKEGKVIDHGNREALMNLALMFGPGAIAFHGSPYKFDKFSMDKIGTGEGAQAYGHGLYFAESPDVAMKYAPRDMGFENALMKKYKKAENAGDYVSMQIYEDFLTQKTPDEIAKYLPDAGYVGEDLKRAQRAFNDATKAYNAQKSSALYKVDISDDAVKNFLDWDKPLSQQPESVRKLVPELFEMQKKIAGGMKPGEAARSLGLNPAYGHMDQGSLIYEILQDKHGADKASLLMKKAGVPGIRYLDQGSRGAEGGTSNFVVFDDELVKILERNGEQLK